MFAKKVSVILGTFGDIGPFGDRNTFFRSKPKKVWAFEMSYNFERFTIVSKEIKYQNVYNYELH